MGQVGNGFVSDSNGGHPVFEGQRSGCSAAVFGTHRSIMCNGNQMSRSIKVVAGRGLGLF